MNEQKLLVSLMQSERANDALKVLIDHKFLPEDSYIQDEVIYSDSLKEKTNGIAGSDFQKHWAPMGNNEKVRINTNVKGQGYNKHAALREKLTNQFDVDLITAAIESGKTIEEIEKDNFDIKEMVNEYVREDVNITNNHFKIKHWTKTDIDKWAARNIILLSSRQIKVPQKDAWRGLTLEFIDQGMGMTNKDICDKFMCPAVKNKESMNFQQGKFSSGGLAILSRVKGGLQLIASKNIKEQHKGWNFSINMCLKGEQFNEYFYLIDLQASDRNNKKFVAYSTPKAIKVFPDSIEQETKEYDGQTFTLEGIRKQQKEIEYGTFLKAYDFQAGEGHKNVYMFQSPNIVNKLDLWSFSPNFPYTAIWDVDSQVESRIETYKNKKREGIKYDKFSIEKKSSKQVRKGLEEYLFGLINKNKPKEAPYFSRTHHETFKYTWQDGKDEQTVEIPIEYYIFDGTQDKYWSKKKKDDPLERIPQEHRTLFICNGQTHATFEVNKFRQVAWGEYEYLHRSMITVVDISKISEHHLSTKLLDDSRTQFHQNKDNTRIFFDRLQEVIKNDPILRQIEDSFAQSVRNQRANELHSDENMQKLMEKFYKNNAMQVIQGSKISTNTGGDDENAEQQQYATKFDLVKGQEEREFTKGINKKETVIRYETDAGNNYFNDNNGSYTVKFFENELEKNLVPEPYFKIHNGKATLHVDNIHKEKLEWPDDKELQIFIEVINNDDKTDNNVPFKSEPKLVLPEPYQGKVVPTLFEPHRNDVQWNYHTKKEFPDKKIFRDLSIHFKTDAENGYFARSEENYPGKLELEFNSSWGNVINITETDYYQNEDIITVKISKNEFKKNRLYNHVGEREYIEMTATLCDPSTDKKFVSEVTIYIGHVVDEDKKEQMGEVASFSWESEEKYEYNKGKIVLDVVDKHIIFNKDHSDFRLSVQKQNRMDAVVDTEQECQTEFGINLWHSYILQKEQQIDKDKIEENLDKSINNLFLALNTRKILWGKNK